MNKSLYLVISLIFFYAGEVVAQEVEQATKERLQKFFLEYIPSTSQTNTCKLDSIRADFRKKKLLIYANDKFSYQPFRPETVEGIYQSIQKILPGPMTYFDCTVFSDGHAIEELIPNIYRKGKIDKDRLFNGINHKGASWVTPASRPYEITSGLDGRHIALWQSHGRYYLNKLNRWSWQRPRLYCTSEDIFTQSFVLPYLIPMLENAGANVFTPRERDTQKHEVIVDNDGNLSNSNSLYMEVESKNARWESTNLPGFAHRKTAYVDNENPFTDGTARFAQTENKKDQAFAEWAPDIPETGKYAVYVSYQTLPNSVNNAKYLVFHKGGVTEFKVNQKIGGGTWVYLGTFEFEKGCKDYNMVVLSNESKERGVVCADAVRFGGGMGNLSRGGQTSGFPRYMEGARYSAQWAGMPYSVYAGYEGKDDLSDDINARSRSVNYLTGGSVFNPTEPGLGIPFELSMALHSDAGFDKDDKTVGTLGIFTTNVNDGLLASGVNRYTSRDFCDILITQLQQDIHTSFNIDWTRRSMWNRNYSETRLPAIPSVIVELLAHQNFADMRLGHDPHFKFTVGRSLYKAILRYLCNQYNKEYVVQPLPVSHFNISFGKKKNMLELSWQGENDPQESTAQPREYIVYTRTDDGGFDNGVRVSTPAYTVKIEPGVIYSFKVTAVNRGGESFPSEILAAYRAKHEQKRVLIVNGFDRISGPAMVNTPDMAGFDLQQDPGVPYLYNISLGGVQNSFDRKEIGKQLVNSGSEYEGMKIVGNCFDYPFIHGKAIQAAGSYSFVSSSDEAVESGKVSLEEYPIVDYILGLEKEDPSTHLSGNDYYKTFSSAMQRAFTAFCRSGGNLLVSGSYVGSDMSSSQGGSEFTQNILKYRYGNSLRSSEGNTSIDGLRRTFSIPRLPNEQAYAVTAPDCIMPTSTAFSAMAYTATNTSAAIAYKGNDYRTFVMGFPFESIREEDSRAAIMASVLQFFTMK